MLAENRGLFFIEHALKQVKLLVDYGLFFFFLRFGEIFILRHCISQDSSEKESQ